MSDSKPPSPLSRTSDPANVTAAVQQAAEAIEAVSPEAAQLLRHVASTVEKHGVTATDRTLDIAFIGTARGKSARNLQAATDLLRHGADANLFISVQPDDTRFPVSIRCTGDLGLSELLGNSAPMSARAG